MTVIWVLPPKRAKKSEFFSSNMKICKLSVKTARLF